MKLLYTLLFFPCCLCGQATFEVDFKHEYLWNIYANAADGLPVIGELKRNRLRPDPATMHSPYLDNEWRFTTSNATRLEHLYELKVIHALDSDLEDAIYQNDLNTYLHDLARLLLNDKGYQQFFCGNQSKCRYNPSFTGGIGWLDGPDGEPKKVFMREVFPIILNAALNLPDSFKYLTDMTVRYGEFSGTSGLSINYIPQYHTVSDGPIKPSNSRGLYRILKPMERTTYEASIGNHSVVFMLLDARYVELNRQRFKPGLPLLRFSFASPTIQLYAGGELDKLLETINLETDLKR